MGMHDGQIKLKPSGIPKGILSRTAVILNLFHKQPMMIAIGMNAKKALQLGFVDGILFGEKNKPVIPEEDEPEEDESDEEPDENNSDEDEENLDKPQKNTTSMLYSSAKTTASLMQKISDMTPRGVAINQLEKRLALLKN